MRTLMFLGACFATLCGPGCNNQQEAASPRPISPLESARPLAEPASSSSATAAGSVGPAADVEKDVVKIGSAGARIVRITAERLDYIDMAGRSRSLDLRLCHQNWMKRHETISKEPWVGERGVLDGPPWVEFLGERTVRFEFESTDALADVLRPLRELGWRTRDGN